MFLGTVFPVPLCESAFWVHSLQREFCKNLGLQLTASQISSSSQIQYTHGSRLNQVASLLVGMFLGVPL